MLIKYSLDQIGRCLLFFILGRLIRSNLGTCELPNSKAILIADPNTCVIAGPRRHPPPERRGGPGRGTSSEQKDTYIDRKGEGEKIAIRIAISIAMCKNMQSAITGQLAQDASCTLSNSPIHL